MAKTNKQTKGKKTTAKPKKRPLETGTIGYRHLPTKVSRFKRQNPPKDLKKLPNSFKITRLAIDFIWQNRKLFLGIALIYGLLNLILVQGLSSNTDISTLKGELKQGNFGTFTTGLSVFAVLVGSAGNGSSSTAGAYQMPIAIISSLAIIWSLRQVKGNHKIRIRDAYYKGMMPLIPFVLVLLVVIIQFIPLAFGAALYSTILSNGVAIGLLEHLLSLAILLLFAAWTFRLVTASILALYIVTLPGMTPLKALRSAKQLVRFQRLSIFRKLLFLPVSLLIVAGIIMLPIILWLTPLSQWIFFILTMLALLCAHTYIYTLYRELLNE